MTFKYIFLLLYLQYQSVKHLLGFIINTILNGDTMQNDIKKAVFLLLLITKRVDLKYFHKYSQDRLLFCIHRVLINFIH